MTAMWGPDRHVRRTMLALGTAGLALICVGTILDALWLLGIGVWAVIVAMLIELVYRP
ncbi:hypothetical protein ACIQZO_08700 [Streptomyces sp. NPDC097617]|uniref:hypothetical protein n=1 Tax=Streptomyces sp. NPDC097617 TaxID=3366091 RepID=UPI00380CFF23